MIFLNGMRGIFSQFSGFCFEAHGLFWRLLPKSIIVAFGENMGVLFHENSVDLGVRKEEKAHEVYFGEEVKIL